MSDKVYLVITEYTTFQGPNLEVANTQQDIEVWDDFSSAMKRANVIRKNFQNSVTLKLELVHVDSYSVFTEENDNNKLV